MYGIFTYIYQKKWPNVGKYTIHGFYGVYHFFKPGVPPSTSTGSIRLRLNLEVSPEVVQIHGPNGGRRGVWEDLGGRKRVSKLGRQSWFHIENPHFFSGFQNDMIWAYIYMKSCLIHLDHLDVLHFLYV